MTGGGLTFSSSHRRGRTRSRWVGRSAVLPSSPFAPQTLKFIVLTISMLGLQLVWSCEMAQASPYLLSLGVSKSMMSVVFVAGPLSGLIVQPIIGVLSDKCKSSFGRRRPFIVAGCAVSAFAVILLGWARELASIVSEPDTSLNSRLTIAIAIISIYLIDFSINVVQAMDRALLVDVISPDLQPAANAWSSRMFGFGAVFGFWFGGLDLVYWTNGYLGDNQLKVICFFTAVFLCSCHAVTVACVRERVLISSEDDQTRSEGDGPAGMVKALKEIWVTMRTLPKPIQQVVNIQFTSWLGWFPVLFFSTTWVAEIYIKSMGFPSSDLASAPADIRDDATRAGTRAMLFHSIVSLTTSILLPPLITSSSTASSPPAPISRHPPGRNEFLVQIELFWRKIKPTLPLPWLSLSLLWAISNGMFSILLMSTYFATSVFGASFIIAAIGFCWAIGNWIPFSLLGELILSLGANPNGPQSSIQLEAGHNWSGAHHSIDQQSPSETAHHQLGTYDDYDDKTPTLSRPDTSFFQKTHRARSSTASSTNESVNTPTSATSAYFEAVMETPDPGRSSPSSLSSPSLIPINSTPPRKTSPSITLTPPPFKTELRRGSHTNVDLFSSHPYEYPIHHDEAASQLTIRDFEDRRTSAANGTTTLGTTKDTSMTILQIRHSDDTYSRGSSFEEDDEQRRENDKEDGERKKSIPMIMVGEESGDWENDPAEDGLDDEIDDGEEEDGAADQAGAILGIHNIYLVLPQFLVTALSSIIFAIFAPHQSVIAHGSTTSPTHPVIVSPIIANSTSTTEDALSGLTGGGIDDLRSRAMSVTYKALTTRAEGEGRDWDALGMIFRFGGIMAGISAILAWKMHRSREREKNRGQIRNSRLGSASH